MKEEVDTEWKKWFDGEIEKLREIRIGVNGYNEVARYLQSDKNILFVPEIYPETFYELDPDKVKVYIDSLLAEARKEERERVVTEIEGWAKMSERLETDYDDEDKRARRDVRPYNEALTALLTFAGSLKKKQI